MSLAGDIQNWEMAIGARVRATMASPELARYFAVEMTPARARIALLQLSLFVSCRRDWIVGTPDDAIAHIERMQAELGGFGGLLLSTHEWAGSDKLRRSYELFARYVMPHFRGHTSGYQDEWRRIQFANANGGLKLDGDDRPSNLATK